MHIDTQAQSHLDNNKQSNMETGLGDNHGRMDDDNVSEVAKTFPSLPTAGGEVNQTYHTGENLATKLKNNVQSKASIMMEQLYHMTLSRHTMTRLYTDPSDLHIK